MNIEKLLKSTRKGSSIGLVVCALVILLAMGGGLISLSLHSQLRAVRTSSEIAARTAADAGLTKAVYVMNQRLQDGTWNSDTLPQSINETLPNCDATFSYQVTGTSETGYVVKCVGDSGYTSKTVSATLRLRGLFDYAVLAQGTISLKNGTLVDGYDSQDPGLDDVPVQIITTSTSADQIILNTGVNVDGDVFVGVDGDPATVIKDLGATTGDRSALQEEPDFTTVTPPTLPDMGGEIYVKGDTLTIGPANSGKYTSIELAQESTKIRGNIYEKFPAILEIAGGEVVIHVTGDISVGESCEIVVMADASLTLYVDGNIHCRANSNIGYEGSPQQPEHMKLYGTGSGLQEFDIKAKSQWSGVVYAPNADIDLFADGDIYGAFVGNSFELKAGGNFYYDAALRDYSETDMGVYFAVDRWQEE
jgi:hypothetical protein